MAAPSSVLALVPSEARKEASIITTKTVERHLVNLYDKSIKLNMLVTAQQIDKLNGFFSPFVFEMAAEATVPQSHLYPKVAEYVGRRLMATAIADGAMEIGGDVKTNRDTHTCSLRTGRDDSRANANRTDPYGALHGNVNLCKEGAEKCAERSNALYANQVYLSQAEVADTIIQKNARVFHLCIIMTPGVLFGGNHVDDGREITTECLDGYALMTFPEGGSGYRHKLSDWQDWHRKNLIKRKGRFFHSELVNSSDWVHYYRVTEVFSPEHFTHQINTTGHGCVAIPDLVRHYDEVMHMCRQKLSMHTHADWFDFYSRMRKILIPSEVFESIISYAHGRDDKQISRQGIAHMLRVEQYVVKVGHTTLKMGFRLPGNDFTSVLTTLAFFVLAQRAITTSTLGSLITSLKHDSTYSFFTELWEDLQRLVTNKDPALRVPVGSADFSKVAHGILRLCSFLYEPMKNQIEEQINYIPLPLSDPTVAPSWEQSMPVGICFEAAVSKQLHGTMKLANRYAYDATLSFQENLDKLDLGDAPIVSRDDHVFLTHTLEESCRHNVHRFRKYPFKQLTEAPELTVFKRNTPGIDSTSTALKAQYMIDLIKTQTTNPQFEGFLKRFEPTIPFLKLAIPIKKLKRSAVFGASVALMCGPPYADCAVFTNHFKTVSVNDYSNVGSHVFPPNVHRLRGRNLLCDDCVGTAMDIIYADFGMDASDFNKLRSSQLQALETLKKSGKFFSLKIQAGENLFAFGPHHDKLHKTMGGLYWYNTNQEATEVWINNMGLGRKVPQMGVPARLGYVEGKNVIPAPPKCDLAHEVFMPKKDRPIFIKPRPKPDFDWQCEEKKAQIKYLYPRREEKPTRVKWQAPAPSAPPWELAFDQDRDFGLAKIFRQEPQPCLFTHTHEELCLDTLFEEQAPVNNVTQIFFVNALRRNVCAPAPVSFINSIKRPKQSPMSAPLEEILDNGECLQILFRSTEKSIIQHEEPEVVEALVEVPSALMEQESAEVKEEEASTVVVEPELSTVASEQPQLAKDVSKPKKKVNKKNKSQRRRNDAYRQAMAEARKKQAVPQAAIETQPTPAEKCIEDSDVVIEQITPVAPETTVESEDWSEVKSYTEEQPSNFDEMQDQKVTDLSVAKQGLEEASRVILDKVPQLVLEKQVPADGNCLFHCFAYFTGKGHEELRNQIMPEGPGWGGDEHIARFARLYHCTVILTQPGLGAQQFGDAGQVYYIHLEDHHFNVYKPVPKKHSSKVQVYVVPSQKHKPGSLVVETTKGGALKFVGNGTKNDITEWKKMVSAFRAVFAPVKLEISDSIPYQVKQALLNDYDDWNGNQELSYRVFEPDMLSTTKGKHLTVLKEAGVGAILEGEVVHKSSNGCWFLYRKHKGDWHTEQVPSQDRGGEKVVIDTRDMAEALHKVGQTTTNASFIVRNLPPKSMSLFIKVVAHTAKHKKLHFKVVTDCKVCYANQFMASGEVGKVIKVKPPKATQSQVNFTPTQLEAGVADLQRALRTDKDIYKDTHEAAIKNLESIDCTQDLEVQVEGLRGVAGCGKTTIVKQQIQTKGTIVVCPFSPLTKTYREIGYKACTIGTFIANNMDRKFDTVLLDEVFAMHPILLAFVQQCTKASRIFAIGDASQMEFGGKDQNPEFVMSKYLSIEAYANVSHSVPLDVVVMLNESGINTSIRCNSSVTNSVNLTTVAPIGSSDLPTFVTTTAAKGYLKQRTVASAQGMRHPEILLYAEQSGLQLLRSNPRMLYVGLTRHTHKLHLVCSEEARSVLNLDFPDLSKHTCVKKGALRKPQGLYSMHTNYLEEGSDNSLEQEDCYDDSSAPAEMYDAFHPQASREILGPAREHSVFQTLTNREVLGEAREHQVYSWMYEFEGHNAGDQQHLGEPSKEEPLFKVIGKELKERARGPTYERINIQANATESEELAILEAFGARPDDLGPAFPTPLQPAIDPVQENALEGLEQLASEKPVSVVRGDEEITLSVNEQVYATLVAYGLPLYSLKAPKVYTRVHTPRFEWHRPNSKIDCQAIERILQEVAPTNQGHNNPFSGLLPTTLPRTQGVMRLLFGGHKSGKLFDINEQPKIAYTIPCMKRGRPFAASHSLQSAHSFASRCGTPSLKLREQEAEALAWQMLETFNDSVNQVSPINSDDLVDGIACMMDAIARRRGERQVAGLDFIQHRSAKIKAFLKTQTKADAKPESWLRVVESLNPLVTGEFDMKAGQTISAQSKAMNILTGGIIRAIEKKVVQDLKPHIVFCQGQAPRTLKRVVKRTKAYLSPVAFECDITQQDALRGEWCNNKVMLEIYKKYAPAWMDPLILQEALNEYWVAANESFSLGVYEHFQSGRSDTLFSNTLVNLLLILSVVDVKGATFVGVQGDDIAVFCDEATPQIPDFLQASLKYQKVAVPSLVGYFVGETLTLDVVRMTIKLINRQFNLPLQRKKGKWSRNCMQLEQYRDAVKAWLSVLEDDKDTACTIAYNADHYNIPKAHSEALLNFLCAFAYSPIEEIFAILEVRVTRPLVF